MGRGLSPMQKELLLFAANHESVPHFRDACEHFDCTKEKYSECPVGILQSLAFGGDPEAKRMLSIRAAVCRSLRRLEERGLMLRINDCFKTTLDGAMMVAVEKVSVNTTTLTVSEESA